MRKVLFLTLILIFSINLFGQNAKRSFDFTEYGVRIEPDKRLMVVLASLEAGGLKTPLTAEGEQYREMLAADLAGVDPALREKIKTFITQYKKRHSKTDDAELIAPFISMAYSLTPVPDLVEPIRATDLPGDLLDVLDYTPLVREFYRKANFGEKLDKYLKMYQEKGDQMRPSTSLMIGKLLDYMHTRPQLTYVEKVKTQSQPAKKNRQKLETTESRFHERRFFIVPELLTAKGTVNFVNQGDDYSAIVPPGTDLAGSEVRRAYLQFVLDPIVLDNAQEIFKHRDAIKALIEERRKTNRDISPDFVLTVSRSLAAAIDARQIEFEKSRIATYEARQKIAALEAEDAELQKKGQFDKPKRDALKKQVVADLNKYNSALADETALLLSEAYEQGAVLTFYFADKLRSLEDSGFDITESIGQMIAAIDTTKEANRLDEVADARARALAEREKRKALAADPNKVIENPVTKKLLAIDEIIKNKAYDDARRQLKDLLLDEEVSREGSEELSRVYYSLGRLESLAAEAATEADTRNYHLIAAKNAYDNVLKNKTDKTDKALLSLTYVALARIYEFNDQNDYAIKIYEAAMNIGEVEGGAYSQAVAAHQRLMKGQQ
ncbi:MAG: hypothetical protein R2747_22890 [Pyrinomonadaceae bacterium]